MAALLRTSTTAILRGLPCSALRSLSLCSFHTSAEQQHSNRACIGRSGRTTFLRSYPVLLVQPDGSTVTIEYKEPRRMLVMPIDISTLSEDERKARLRLRNQARKTSAKKEQEIDDDFNPQEYRQFWKKK
ncbi:large ribosomal subunit protein mL55 [Dendrobates tinctorius]|uniref:large ribosomal subunit protein mL55 n=1 Tax=Dendrobates tinctorius TaxID=92724 RepID=UPI003CC93365